MKKQLLALAVGGTVLAGANLAQASTVYSFNDTFIDDEGAQYSTSDTIAGQGNVSSIFNITKTEVSLNDDSTVTVNLYSVENQGYFTTGINEYGLGDLFVSTTGTTDWDYVVDLNYNYDSASEFFSDYDESGMEADLYALADGGTITNGAMRDYQPASYEASEGQDILETGTWSIEETTIDGVDYLYLSITMDLSEVWDGTTPLTFSWTMACGNDMIRETIPAQESNPVPAPATGLLLGTGLLGLLGFTRRKQ